MDHPKKRVYTFEIEGEKYGLRFSTNALVSTEEAMDGVAFGDLTNDLGEGTVSITALRALVYGGMRGYEDFVNGATPGAIKHRDLDAVGELLDKHGILEWVPHVVAALQLMFPDTAVANGAEAAEAPEDPPVDLEEESGGETS
jgi:hypothetical protein